MKLHNNGVYVTGSGEIFDDVAAFESATGKKADQSSASCGTIAYGILKS